MKNTLLGLSILFLSACGVSLQSVVDSNLTQSYKNPLLVIPYDNQKTFFFSANLKSHLEDVFSENNQKVQVILSEQPSPGELTLNTNTSPQDEINIAISEDHKDLLIIFQPVKLEYVNGGLVSATYQLVSTDIKTKKEVWKANYSSSGSFGPSTFGRPSAQKIYQKLKGDGVL